MVFLGTIIATFYPGTLGKIIMNPVQMHRLCKDRVDAIIDRMHELCAEGRSKDAQALYDEIRDWVITKDDLEIMSLEYLAEFDT